MHKEAITPEMLDVLHKLMSVEALAPFRLVGGTAIALQIGHRKSIDIDLFCNEQVNKQSIVASIQQNFADTECFTTSYCINARIKDVKIDIYDQWSIPFVKPILTEDGIRISALEDLAAFKLTAFTERREKKDYIDLYFLFNKFDGVELLKDYKKYNPLLSQKSLLFALHEVDTAEVNKSVMPEMLLPFSWTQAKKKMHQVAKDYFRTLNKQ